jgi:hypothetical protein
VNAKSISVGLIGAGIGVLIAAVQALVSRGDVYWWQWVLTPVLVAGLFLWLASDFDSSRGK